MKNDRRLLVREFLDKLDEEEKLVEKFLFTDRLGLVLRTAISELDWYYFNLKQVAEANFEQQEQFYLLSLGVSRLVKKSLEARENFDVPTITLRRQKMITLKTLEIVSRLGFIEHGRRIAFKTMSGNCQIEKVSEKYFKFTLQCELINSAADEDSISGYYRTEQSKLLEPYKNSQHAKNIEEMMVEHVFVFRNHFIGYSSDPMIDDHFFRLAHVELSKFEGFDSFPGEVKFGGVTYQKYLLTIAYFLHLTLKHEAFCKALVIKHPEIRYEDILTITSEKNGFISSIHEALNTFCMFTIPVEGYKSTTNEETEKIYEVLSIGRSNTALLDRVGSELPFIIEFSETGLIRSITGAQQNPISFLLKALKYHYPGDYDRHQQMRELSAQRAIQKLLSATFTGLIHRNNIQLSKQGQRLTDIDHVVFEPGTGTLLLFQIKSQDSFGPDPRDETNRVSKLKCETSRWMSVVRDWLASESSNNVKSTFQLPRNSKIGNYHLVVLSKNFAFPLKELLPDHDFIFANWIQFFNAVELLKQQYGSLVTLNGLVKLITDKIIDSKPKYHEPEGSAEYNLETLSYVIIQAEKITRTDKNRDDC